MTHELSVSDLRIVEALERHGPRNVTDVAKKLGMPAETLRKRLRRLRSDFFCRTGVNIYHTFLGLKKAVVFAEAHPGYEDLLFNGLKAHDFWIFVSRCYGTFEGCVGIFTIPKEHEDEFKQFAKSIRKLGIAKDVRIFWSTCFQSVNLKCDWFDEEADNWDFRWDEWIDEIKQEQTDLPYTLVDPEGFPIKGDKTDVLILKELEKDATTSFVELGNRLGMSPQKVGYRYQKHLIERGLIENFRVSAFHFGKVIADFYFFILEFDSNEKFARFTSSLLDKPFARALGKILGQNWLYTYLYLPKTEFRKFRSALAQLVRTGFVKSYQYAIQDLQASSRQTISYEYFENGRWTYDHEKHQEKLKQLIESSIYA